MTLKEFNTFLEKYATNEMFESLVLYHIRDTYMVTGCCTNTQGYKTYVIQDLRVGNKYYLIIDFSNNIKEGEYPQEKYMIARKDLKTIYFLIKELPTYRDEKIPANCRDILHFLKQSGMENSKFLKSKGTDFTKHIDKLVAEQFEQFQTSMDGLYHKFVDKMIEQLFKTEYILEANDWNRKTGKIKLTGANGKNRVCKSRFHTGVGYVFFNIEKPYDHILQYLTEEKDVDLLVTKILKMLRNQKNN